MTIELMQANVIHRWGFEHPATLYFFQACELNDSDQLLNEIAYTFAMGWDDVDAAIDELLGDDELFDELLDEMA